MALDSLEAITEEEMAKMLWSLGLDGEMQDVIFFDDFVAMLC